MPGKPGVATHVPKRSTERRRRNAVNVTSAANTTDRRGPDAPEWLTGAGLAWYESLRTSGQSVWYTDSDWSTAVEIVARAVSAFAEKPSAHLLTAIMSACNSLAVTEGDRRRLRIELERAADDADEAASVMELDKWQQRFRAGSSNDHWNR